MAVYVVIRLYLTQVVDVKVCNTRETAERYLTKDTDDDSGYKTVIHETEAIE